MEVIKILIIRFSSIGDIILASPLIRSIRSTYHDAQIDFLVKKEFAELVKYNPHLSNIIEFGAASNFNQLTNLANRIKKENYNTIIDIHNSLRSRYIRGFSIAANKIIIKKNIFARFFLIIFKWNFYKHIVPNAQKYLNCAIALSVKDDGKGLEVFVPDKILSKITSHLNNIPLSDYKIIIGAAPSAKHNTKKWLPERYVQLLSRLIQELNGLVMVFGGTEDKHESDNLVNSVNDRTGKKAAMNFSGKFSLLENAAALDFCDVFITNDTGLMHLASARRRKVVAIFGPTVKEFGFFPYRTEHIVVERNDLNCRPCTHIGSDVCPKKHFRCMNNISTDDVYNAVLNILNIKTQ
jgi:lipopolysaccharide heptosyltransferase II